MWFEVEVKTDQGWGLVTLPPLMVHGGMVQVEAAKRYPSMVDAVDHCQHYGLPLRIFICRKDSRVEVK